MPYIRESIITTADKSGKVHIAPIGIIAEKDGWVIAPFRPSITLDNLAEVPFAVANYTDDVRIFAGCLTGRKDWPTVPVDGFPVPRLAAALAHSVLQVESICRRRRAAAPFLPRGAGRDACAVHRPQPRQGGGAGTGHPGQPAEHAAARQDRGRDRLSLDCHRKDRRPRRKGSLGLADAEGDDHLADEKNARSAKS